MVRRALSLPQGLLPVLYIFLALTRAAYSAVVSAPGSLAHRRSSTARENGSPTGLRGGLHVARHQKPIVTLQTSSKAHKVKRTSKLARMVRRQTHMTRREWKAENGLCRGRKLIWWIKVKRKCEKAYGEDSKWDRSKLGGQCRRAWQVCNTGFYAVCCSQPKGPATLQAYCDKKGLEEEEGKDTKKDKACEVQGKVAAVNKQMRAISQTVKLMDDKITGKLATTTTATRKPTTTMTPSPTPKEEEDDDDEQAVTTTEEAAPIGILFGPAPSPASVDMIEPIPEKSMAIRCKQLTDVTQKAAEKIKEIKKWAIKDGIRRIEGDETSRKDEKEAEEHEDPEASDPDLVFKVRGVLKIGQKLDSLIAANTFCAKEVHNEKEVLDAEDDEEEDKNDILEDLKKDPTREWFGDKKKKKEKKKEEEEDKEDDEDEDDDDDREQKVKVITRTKYKVKYVQMNTSAVVELLEFDHDMKKKVDEFETEVHPHGFKWWRYRYEYSMLESFVLAYSVMLLYILKFFIFGLSFFRIHKFYRTGKPAKIYRYPFIYFVFHAACVCIMVFMAYMMYVPWGQSNPFNLFATAFHDFVDGAFNAPYLGYSWLFLILDIQFQLFATYAMYAVFVSMVARNYIMALDDWRLMDDHEGEKVTLRNPHNGELYAKLKKVVVRRVEMTKSLRNLFYEKQLRLVGVEKLDTKVPAADNKHWHEFKLHLYLTEGLGRSIEYLVEVSLVTNLWLAISALIVALLAHTCQMAFMYFLPGFVVISFGLFVAGYLMSKHYIRLAEDLNYQMPKEPESEADDDDASKSRPVTSSQAPTAKAPFGFKVGQLVTFIGKDDVALDGATGTITGFTNDKVKVTFTPMGDKKEPKGEIPLPPHLLVKAKADFVNCHTYCRAVQIVLYCIFYSFARLILSQDIFTHYPKVYLSACCALGLVFVFLWFFGGQLLKEATCALILVPHISYSEFKKHLEQIVKWHIQVNCHECGVGQPDYRCSSSGEWAGNHPSGQSGEGTRSTRSSPRSSQFSFR